METEAQKTRRKSYDKKRRADYVRQGLCCRCGENPLCSKRLCEKCLTTQQQNRLKLAGARNQLGLCGKCGKAKNNQTQVCEKCILRRTAQLRLGNPSRWQELQELLEKQNCSCPYTGIKLKLGENASLDHVVPKSRGGTNDLSNLEWVHVWVNLMKNNTSKSEFVPALDRFLESASFCRSIEGLPDHPQNLSSSGSNP
jgi:hypothetical protein